MCDFPLLPLQALYVWNFLHRGNWMGKRRQQAVSSIDIFREETSHCYTNERILFQTLCCSPTSPVNPSPLTLSPVML